VNRKVTVQELLNVKDEQNLQLISKKGGKSGMLVVKCAPSVFDLSYCDFKAYGTSLGKKHLRGLPGTGFFPLPFFFSFSSSLPLLSPSLLAPLESLIYCLDSYFVIKTPLNINERRSIRVWGALIIFL